MPLCGLFFIFLFNLYLTWQVSKEQILIYNDGLHRPNLDDAGPILRPMGLPITAGCDTACIVGIFRNASYCLRVLILIHNSICSSSQNAFFSILSHPRAYNCHMMTEMNYKGTVWLFLSASAFHTLLDVFDWEIGMFLWLSSGRYTKQSKATTTDEATGFSPVVSF
jgi:hypothetical protein